MIIVCLLLGLPALLCLFSFMPLIVFNRDFTSGHFARSILGERLSALNFDDGPDSSQTPQSSEVLKEYQVNACFSCNT